MQIEKIFKKNFDDFLNQKNSTFYFKNIISSVSGGSDSLALSIITQKYCDKNKIPHFSIIIDHNVRENSSKEAILVSKRLTKLNISSRILKINNIPPKRGIQKWCRVNRFSLLSKVAREEVGIILLGHHLDDQIETVLMRLQHSSGLNGLSGIRKEVTFNGIMFYRPFLDVKKSQIINYCKSNSLTYVNDKSNYDNKFERVRIRNFIKNSSLIKLEKKLLSLKNSSEKICTSLKNYVNLWIKKYVKITYPLYVKINFFEFNNLNSLIKEFILNEIFQNLGSVGYLPKKKSILRLIENISFRNVRTLSGCKIIPKAKDILIIREYGRRENYCKKIKKDQIITFDERWLMRSNYDGYVKIQNINDKFFLKKFSFLPKEVLSLIPVLVTLDDSLIHPYLIFNTNGIYDENIISNKSDFLIWST